MAVAPKLAWRALTDARELRLWAADAADMELNSGGPVAIRGGVAPRGEILGDIQDVERDTRLAFVWAIDGHRTPVEWIVSSLPQGGWSNVVYTEVTVRQDLGPDDEDSDWTWRTLWSLWLRALRAWCERGETRIAVDSNQEGQVVIERIAIRASAAEIWPYLSEPERVKRWFHEELGPEIRRLEGQRITYQWPEPGMESEVTWSLVCTDENISEVVVQHALPKPSGFPYRVGWKDYLVELSYQGGRPRIAQTIHVDAPPERVWPYLSTREGMESWWSSITEFRPGLGGYVQMQEHGSIESGDIVEWEPNRRMAFLWREADHSLMVDAPLKITILLVPEDGGTRVILYDEGFERLPESILRGYQLGWAIGEELERLAKALA
ncbi:SRPBCC domain-containing protein [Sulfobacillus harzensis]|uniref:Activator of Hsp90 ATPase homologue 1/2-like C-terminal domain-containing protein n=1 Tax=Sulfobacillus harzensis TaxID=2729629 RepID=A0A7Y0L6J1_9FIRM|nr:SRPBCC domain-containing protein [Sulfobacillus harzensis]NMP23953.1 hypothetical protein [Sulfobacillus harzensis]